MNADKNNTKTLFFAYPCLSVFIRGYFVFV